ncbi:MAG: CotH kinase family protein [Acutalibacteraceae bacterium]
MKKILAILLTVAMLCAAVPVCTASAFDNRVIYTGSENCRLLTLSLTQADNPWMLYDIGFTADSSGRVLTTDADHPNMVGRTVKLAISYLGDSVAFNGKAVVSGETEVKLSQENTLTVYGDNTKAEYQINITETTSGLPVVLLDTDGAAIPDKINYVDVSVSVLGGTVDYAGKDIYCATGGIKLRGNSTSAYDKKPYRLKLDSKINPFGLGKAKSWTLIANFLDESLMRNRVCYSFGTRMNEWSGVDIFVPRMCPVEVYLNGEYRGLYDLGDHMQANEIRVNVAEEASDPANPATIGYYFESEYGPRVYEEGQAEGVIGTNGGIGENAPYFVVENTGGYGSFSYYQDINGNSIQDGLYYQFKCPDPPTEDQITYIKSKMDNINALIQAKDSSLWDYLDLDSTVNWYLQNEIFKNVDSHYSMYLFKPEATYDEAGVLQETKVYMGPLWDFDIAIGAMDYSYCSDPTGWRTREAEYSNWFNNMFEMDEFRTALTERWNAMKTEGILDTIFTDIDTFYGQIAVAADSNRELWHDNYTENTQTGMYPSNTLRSLDSSLEQVQYLKSFMYARIEWIDEQLTGYMDLTPATKTVSGTNGTVVSLPVNRTIGTRDLKYWYLDVTATTDFDIRFVMTSQAWSVGGTGEAVGSPCLKDDWTTNQSGTQWLDMNYYIDSQWSSWGQSTHTYDELANYVLDHIEVTFYGTGSVTINSLYACDNNTTPPSSETIAADQVVGGRTGIWGLAEYGSTLTAASGGVTPRNAEHSYQWLRDGNAISGATDQTYTLTAADVGRDISVRISAEGFSGTVTSESVTVARQSNATKPTLVPSLVSATAYSLTLTDLGSGYEYSLDGENWQASPTFTGLTADSAYAARCRKAATDTVQASQASDAVIVFTDLAAMLLGDTNGDQEVSTSDARMVMNYLLDRETFYIAETACSDVNEDGVINSVDARIILQLALKDAV